MVALATFTASAQVGIGVPTANIDASAQLEVASTNKGFLAPRMTETQKNAITSPAVGLLVYQTDGTAGFYFYDGTTWKQGLGPQGATGAAGAAGVAGQTNTSLLYPSASIYADGAAPTDAPSTVTSTYGNFGWYFKKTGNSKVNWYIQPKSSSMKVSDLTGLYLELFNVAITSASDMPFITVYTKADASSPNAASWYKSKRSYLFSATPAANTKYLGFVNLGANSPNSYNNNLLNLAVENFLSRGDYAQTEDILMISINTNSVASACEFVANKLGVISGSGTQEFLFMPPSSIANLSSYATTLALNTETSRAQAAETTLTSSVNDLSNNVIQNYATNTSVNVLANDVIQNYATNTFVNNLANDVIQNYATKTSVTDLANDVIQNYATNTAVNNLSNNLTGTIQQLEGQVAQSTSDISALGSSLNEKAPIASPSFTGTVTVGGTSSTASAAVEVSSTTQGFLPPRMTAAQRDAINSPVAGLVLWCSNCGTYGELEVYNGTTWTNAMGGSTGIALLTPIVTPIIETYNFYGSAQGPNSATNTGTGTSYTYIYLGTGSTSYGPSATAPSAEGTYTVTVTVAANGNYLLASSAPTAFSILPAAYRYYRATGYGCYSGGCTNIGTFNCQSLNPLTIGYFYNNPENRGYTFEILELLPQYPGGSYELTNEPGKSNCVTACSGSTP